MKKIKHCPCCGGEADSFEENLNFENSIQKEIKRIVDEIGGGVYVEIWVGGMRNPAYSLIATNTELTNNGNAVRIYTADGEIFETSTNNVVMQLLGKEKEKFLPPK